MNKIIALIVVAGWALTDAPAHAQYALPAAPCCATVVAPPVVASPVVVALPVVVAPSVVVAPPPVVVQPVLPVYPRPWLGTYRLRWHARW